MNAETPDSQQSITRRRFLTRLSIGMGSAVAALVGAPVIAFIFGPLLKRTPEEWRSVGPVNSFAIGKTVAVAFEDASPLPWAGVTAHSAAWLRCVRAGEFIAFAINCSHLGCPVRWLADAELFMCPCHGGVYHKDGSVAAGPPPKPLSRLRVRIRNGQVEILTAPIPIT